MFTNLTQNPYTVETKQIRFDSEKYKMYVFPCISWPLVFDSNTTEKQLLPLTMEI